MLKMSLFVRSSCYAPAVKRPSIAIVGAGRLGTALASRLASAGYSISEIIYRDNRRSLAAARQLAGKLGTRAWTISTAPLPVDLVWFCVPDAEVSKAATRLSNYDWEGKIAFHPSGVLTSDALEVLREKGAAVASVHPLMTFVSGALPDLQGVTFALEGDARAIAVARKIIGDLGGNALRLRKPDKVAYHAFATLICPLLVALLATAEETAALAGISRTEARRRMLPIIRQTLANYTKLGPAGSFSGPIVRGDVATIRQHLKALAKAPAVTNAYVALAKAALAYLPSQSKREIRDLLRTVSPERILRNVQHTNPASKRSTLRS
jgi:predicted short-subunit dehydrogenase-like oxidoreductase (DUF2520 family)